MGDRSVLGNVTSDGARHSVADALCVEVILSESGAWVVAWAGDVELQRSGC